MPGWTGFYSFDYCRTLRGKSTCCPNATQRGYIEESSTPPADTGKGRRFPGTVFVFHLPAGISRIVVSEFELNLRKIRILFSPKARLWKTVLVIIPAVGVGHRHLHRRRGFLLMLGGHIGVGHGSIARRGGPDQRAKGNEDDNGYRESHFFTMWKLWYCCAQSVRAILGSQSIVDMRRGAEVVQDVTRLSAVIPLVHAHPLGKVWARRPTATPQWPARRRRQWSISSLHPYRFRFRFEWSVSEPDNIDSGRQLA